MFCCRSYHVSQRWSVDILDPGEFHMPEEFSSAFQQMVRVGELGPIIEAQTDVLLGGRDPAKMLCHLLWPGAVSRDFLAFPDRLDHLRQDLIDKGARFPGYVLNF
jgi:hypothetical protein